MLTKPSNELLPVEVEVGKDGQIVRYGWSNTGHAAFLFWPVRFVPFFGQLSD
jgi:hypothetical protein